MDIAYQTLPPDYRVQSSYRGSWSINLALMFLFIAIILTMIIIFYNLFWRQTIPATTCQNNNNCGVGQTCQSGICIEITCSSDSDCLGNGICINSFCTALTCLNGNDCPTGTACVSGNCIQVGGTCQVNADCFELSCMALNSTGTTGSICVQCLSNNNCPIGQGCFNNACRFPYAGETGINLINYASVAQENGNITAPPGYFCSTSTCGGLTGPISCTGTNTCPSSCSYCIDSVCRCTPGQLLEPCSNNSDCTSGLCGITELGQVCIPIGGECISNYDGSLPTGSNGIRVCPVSRPYCVNGTCSTTSLGAVCGASGLPDDLCNNPLSLGLTGVTGVTPEGMGFFCVNGICQSNPGQLNSLCTTGSCEFIQDGILVCDNTTDNNTDNTTTTTRRCIVGV